MCVGGSNGAWMCVCVCVPVWSPEDWLWVLSFNTVYLSFWGKVSRWTSSSRLWSHKDLPASTFLLLELQVCIAEPGFYVRVARGSSQVMLCGKHFAHWPIFPAPRVISKEKPHMFPNKSVYFSFLFFIFSPFFGLMSASEIAAASSLHAFEDFN